MKSNEKRYYQDIRLHESYRSRIYHLTQDEMVGFAGTWDPQPFHVYPDYKGNDRISGLFASGVHLLAICVKLFSETIPPMALVAGIGWDNIKFIAPARPGDDLVFEGEVISKRESKSDEKLGLVGYTLRLVTQNSEAVLEFRGTIMVSKRPQEK